MSIWAKTWAYSQHPRRIDDKAKVTDKKHPAAKSVLVALAEYPGPGQRVCWPSQKTLALMTDYSERQVRACLSDLEAQGLIKRTERKRTDGTRRSDMIELLGPIEAFGPVQDASYQPEESSGGQGHQPEESSGGTRKRVPGMNRKLEPSSTSLSYESAPTPSDAKNNVAKKKNWTDVLFAEFKNYNITITPEDHKHIPGNLAKCQMKEGATDDEMNRLILQMVMRRLDNVILSPQRALGDVRGNKRNGYVKPEPQMPPSVIL